MLNLNAQQVIAQSGVAFGTSGARGLVTQFTPQVCAAFCHAFIAILPKGVRKVLLGIDNRPSSPVIASYCYSALLQQGIRVEFCGVLPTPALAFAAMQPSSSVAQGNSEAIFEGGSAAIMVTGSHIPFDRNGLKFYRPEGEITKADEQAMVNSAIEFVLSETQALPAVDSRASTLYLQRYSEYFAKDLAQGLRIGIYEHSSAGRDLYAQLLQDLGAEVVSLGRSDEFVPIDTEAVSAEDEAKANAWAQSLALDLIFSTDGDGDRPLVADETGEWFRGDILGLLAAKALGISHLAVPVSCNSAIEQSGFFHQVLRTKIGSPYVIAAFDGLAQTTDASTQLKAEYAVAGFEANGGFLLGSDVAAGEKILKALPTRDAVLPFLALLQLARQTAVKKGEQAPAESAIQLLNEGSKLKVSLLKALLPQRFTYSDRLVNFATAKSQQLITSAKHDVQQFAAQLGLAAVISQGETDGLRLTLADQTIVHLRPSGNAPELRCYGEAATSEAARALVHNVLNQLKAG